jgi:hypothetical protein
MVNLPPDPNDRQPSSPLRDRDEAIALAVAFLAIGSILWWGWTRGQRFFGPLVGGADLEQPFITDEPIVDIEGVDEPLINFGEDEAIEGDAFPRFLGREEATVEREVAIESDRSVGLARPRTAVVPRAIIDEETEEAIAAPTDIEESTSAPEETAIDETATPPPLDISDVSEDYWAYPYIVDLYEAGLLPDFPSGQLQPDKQLTRAEFAALLNSSFVQNEPGQRDLNFSDVSADYWASDAIQQVVDAGYMSGYPDGEFKPSELVPRYQVFVTLASGLDLADPSNPQEVLAAFQGSNDVPDWAQAKVAAAAENKIVVNYPNPQELAPQQPATRAEIIVMIHQALLNQGRVEEIPSPYVNPQG